MRNLVVYLIRTAIAWILLVLLLSYFSGVFHPEYYNGNKLIHLMMQLDIVHHLFYSWLLVFILLFFFLPILLDVLSRRGGVFRWSVGLSLALLLSILPLVGTWFARQKFLLSWTVIAGPIYLFCNLAWLLIHSALAEGKYRKVFRLLYGLGDMLFPLPAWFTYRREKTGLIAPCLLIPFCTLACIGIAPLALNALDPSPGPITRHVSHALTKIADFEAYQIAVDPKDGGVIGSDIHETFVKLDPTSGQLLSKTVMEGVWDYCQGFFSDRQRREILYADPCSGMMLAYSMDDLSLLRKVHFDVVDKKLRGHCGQERHGNRTVGIGESGQLVSYTFDVGFTLFDPKEGIQVTCRPDSKYKTPCCGFTADMAVDNEGQRLFWIGAMRCVVAFDLTGNQLIARYELPSVPERIAYSKQYDQLYVTMPILGQVFVFDASDLRLLKKIRTFPGVRTVAVSSNLDLLVLGGFSPILEFRSLEEGTLIDRYVAPYWQRWIAFDEKRSKIFISDHSPGIWKIDFQPKGQSGLSATIRRKDPFYPAIATVAGWLRIFLRIFSPDSYMLS